MFSSSTPSSVVSDCLSPSISSIFSDLYTFFSSPPLLSLSDVLAFLLNPSYSSSSSHSHSSCYSNFHYLPPLCHMKCMSKLFHLTFLNHFRYFFLLYFLYYSLPFLFWIFPQLFWSKSMSNFINGSVFL